MITEWLSYRPATKLNEMNDANFAVPFDPRVSRVVFELLFRARNADSQDGWKAQIAGPYFLPMKVRPLTTDVMGLALPFCFKNDGRDAVDLNGKGGERKIHPVTSLQVSSRFHWAEHPGYLDRTRIAFELQSPRKPHDLSDREVLFRDLIFERSP
jgi:hypothetical protein